MKLEEFFEDIMNMKNIEDKTIEVDYCEQKAKAGVKANEKTMGKNN